MKSSGRTGLTTAPVFHVELTIKGHDKLIAEGASRQEAEKQAARKFLAQIGYKA